MSNIDNHVGKRIKLRRKLLNLSRENLGCMIGVSSQQIQKYESGVSSVKSAKLLSISTSLRVEPGYFFENYSDGNNDYGVADQEYVRDLHLSDRSVKYDDILNQEETLELVNLYYRIKSEKTRRSLIEFLEGITKTSAISSKKESALSSASPKKIEY